MKPFSLALIIAVGTVTGGCSLNETTGDAGARTLSAGAKGQFECADRNANEYIDQTELVYLKQCGIGENLECGEVPETGNDRPPSSDLNFGLRVLQVTDADNDDRISKLEFRAHCNSARGAE